MLKKGNIQRTVLGLTTAAVISLGLGDSNILPSKIYTGVRPVFESRYSWESQGGDFGAEYREILDKYEIIHGFASKIVENSVDLDPAIVEFVSKSFWNLI